MAALAELSVWALALVCLGIAALITVLVVALFEWLINLLNSVPTVNIGTGWLHTTERAILDALGTAFGKVNAVMGASLHLMARYTEELWNEIRGHAALIAEIASGLYPLVLAYEGIRSLVHRLEHAGATTNARIKSLEKQWHGIEHGVRDFQRATDTELTRVIKPEIKSLDKELERIKNHTIPAIRTAESDAAAAISDLYSWARGKAALVGVGTFALAVAAAIGADVFRAIRCPSFLSSFSKRGCGLWNGLEDLLGLFVDVTLFTNVCAILDFLSPFVSDVAAPIVTALTDVGAGLCEGGIGAPPALPEQTLYLPTSPGVTLNLP